MSAQKKLIDYDLIKKYYGSIFVLGRKIKKAFGINRHKGLFGIVQGGLFKDLRIKSLNELMNIGFDGYALGGLAVGETQQEMFSVLDDVKEYLPDDKPHYLYGCWYARLIFLELLNVVLICLIV